MADVRLARTRIETLLDPGSFAEIGSAMTARLTDFTPDPKLSGNDGVITGHGLVDGNLVFVYSQDPSSLGGTLGEMHAKKICALYDMASKVGAPVVGMLDSKGIRLLESVDAAESLGLIINKMASCSGVVPMISVIFDTLGGGMAALASVSDFTFMEEKAHLFVTSPNGVKGVNPESKDPSCASAQMAAGGVVDASGSTSDILGRAKYLISMLPSCSMEEGRSEASCDDLNRMLAPSLKNAGTEEFIASLVDNGIVFPVKDMYAREMFCGLARLGGTTVGIVANRSEGKDAARLSGISARKAASFIRFLDSFDIPVLTITDVGGFANDLYSEITLPLALAELAMALANSSCPKINLLRNGITSAYLFMNAKSLSADLVYAYRDSKLELLPAKEMAQAIAEETKGSVDDIQAKLKSDILGAENAARRGFVDCLIEVEDTRKYLIAGFDMLKTKTLLPYKKHDAK